MLLQVYYRNPAPAADTGPLPLSHRQRALCCCYQVAPHSPVYNVAAAAPIRRVRDADAPERAFARLAERHLALRTVFSVSDDGELRQAAQGVGGSLSGPPHARSAGESFGVRRRTSRTRCVRQSRPFRPGIRPRLGHGGYRAGCMGMAERIIGRTVDQDQ